MKRKNENDRGAPAMEEENEGSEVKEAVNMIKERTKQVLMGQILRDVLVVYMSRKDNFEITKHDVRRIEKAVEEMRQRISEIVDKSEELSERDEIIWACMSVVMDVLKKVMK